MESGKNSSTKHRGIYLLPNLFTTAGLFAGFYAIIAANKAHFGYAAIGIYGAMIMDALDGRIARLTNTQTAFGAEFDSLSDMVSFGVAPALVAYSWVLSGLGKVGWLAAFIYTACGALRLARFNTQVGKSDKRYFQGLPIPAAAGLVAGTIWIGHEFKLRGDWMAVIVAVLTVLAGLLMVSNLRYYSFKEFDLRGKVPFIAILIVMLIFVGIAIDPPQILFYVFFVYGLSGPVMTLWEIRRHRGVRIKRLRRMKKYQQEQSIQKDKKQDNHD